MEVVSKTDSTDSYKIQRIERARTAAYSSAVQSSTLEKMVLGEDIMKRLVMTSTMMIMLFGLAGEALAVKKAEKDLNLPPEIISIMLAEKAAEAREAKKAAISSSEIPAMLTGEALVATKAETVANPPVEIPTIRITTTPNKLHLGLASFPGVHESSSELTVNVDSNFMYGSILASISPLRRSGGGSISPENIFVQGPATKGYVAMKKPVAVSNPAAGSSKIPLNFKVETEFSDPAGRYEGILMFTVVPPS